MARLEGVAVEGGVVGWGLCLETQINIPPHNPYLIKSLGSFTIRYLRCRPKTEAPNPVMQVGYPQTPNPKP